MRGCGELAAGRWEDAAATLSWALSEAQEHRVGLFEEASLMAYLAVALLGLGDEEAARSRADEAVAVARRQGAGVLECLALLTRARILRDSKVPDDVVHDDLAAALVLVQETGAATYEPFIREQAGRLRNDDSELREALRSFTAIGAHGQARRLERELASP